MKSEKFFGVAFGVSFLNEDVVTFVERLGVEILVKQPTAFNSINVFVETFVKFPSNAWVSVFFPYVDFVYWVDEVTGTKVLIVFVQDTFIGVSGEVSSSVLPTEIEPMTEFWLESILKATNFSSKQAGWLYFANAGAKV
jgi:hypothetical protein